MTRCWGTALHAAARALKEQPVNPIEHEEVIVDEVFMVGGALDKRIEQEVTGSAVDSTAETKTSSSPRRATGTTTTCGTPRLSRVLVPLQVWPVHSSKRAVRSHSVPFTLRCTSQKRNVMILELLQVRVLSWRVSLSTWTEMACCRTGWFNRAHATSRRRSTLSVEQATVCQTTSPWARLWPWAPPGRRLCRWIRFGAEMVISPCKASQTPRPWDGSRSTILSLCAFTRAHWPCLRYRAASKTEWCARLSRKRPFAWSTAVLSSPVGARRRDWTAVNLCRRTFHELAGLHCTNDRQKHKFYVTSRKKKCQASKVAHNTSQVTNHTSTNCCWERDCQPQGRRRWGAFRPPFGCYYPPCGACSWFVHLAMSWLAAGVWDLVLGQFGSLSVTSEVYSAMWSVWTPLQLVRRGGYDTAWVATADACVWSCTYGEAAAVGPQSVTPFGAEFSTCGRGSHLWTPWCAVSLHLSWITYALGSNSETDKLNVNVPSQVWWSAAKTNLCWRLINKRCAKSNEGTVPPRETSTSRSCRAKFRASHCGRRPQRRPVTCHKAQVAGTRRTSLVIHRRSHVTNYAPHVTRDTLEFRSHMSRVAYHKSFVTRNTSHVTRHTSHVSRDTSHVTRHTSQVACHTSHVQGRRWQVARPTSQVTWSQATSAMARSTPHNSNVTCHMSQIPGHTAQAKSHTSTVTRQVRHITDDTWVPHHTAHVARQLSQFAHQTSQKTTHTSHVKSFNSHVIGRASHITSHKSIVTRHTSHVKRHTSLVTGHKSHVWVTGHRSQVQSLTRYLSKNTCRKSQVPRHNVARHTSHDTSHKQHVTRESLQQTSDVAAEQSSNTELTKRFRNVARRARARRRMCIVKLGAVVSILNRHKIEYDGYFGVRQLGWQDIVGAAGKLATQTRYPW